MKVGFAGTPAFAATALAALLDAGFSVPWVLTRPDRPRGRGLLEEPSPVKALALARGIPVVQPATLASGPARESLLSTSIDVLAVAAYGLLLPPALLAWPRLGCLNVHASLLPRWRGAAPIQRALLAGDAESGVTIMQMDAGLDTGPTLESLRVPIGARETSGTLERKLADAGSSALVGVLRRLAAGDAIAPTPQPRSGATYAPKVAKAEAAIDWRTEANAIDRQIRAFDPTPGAFASLAGRPVKIWRAEPATGSWAAVAPGTVVEASHEGLVVSCGQGALEISELQAPGARRMDAAAYLAGRPLPPGTRFDAAVR